MRTGSLSLGWLAMGLLIFVTAHPILAAEAVKDEAIQAELEQLQKDSPELTKEDLEQIKNDVLRPEGAVQGERPELGAGPERGLGRPYLGPEGETPKDLTPKEKALMERAGNRANELEAQGYSRETIDKTLRGEFEKEFKQFEGKEREWMKDRDDKDHKEGYEKAMREMGEGRERMDRSSEHPVREMIERPVSDRPESTRDTAPRETTTPREGSGQGPERPPMDGPRY